MPHRPFRFGALCRPLGSRREWTDQVRMAEELGYSIVLVSDHFAERFEPMLSLAIAAEVTEMRLGTLVLANDFRHPVMLAKEAATLDLLSDGRLELGIGTGWLAQDYLRSGIPFDPPGVRVDRLEEAIRVLKGLWSGEPFSFSGNHYRVEMQGQPEPLQRPHPPLLIAGSGRRMLGLAARHADIVSLTATAGHDSADGFWGEMIASGDLLGQRVEWVRAGAAERPAVPELNVLIHEVSVTQDRMAAAKEMGAEAAIDPDLVLGSPHVLIGAPEQMADDLLGRRERFGISYIVFPAPVMQAMAPVVSRLSGA